MRLSSLHPGLSHIHGSERYELTFDCAKCQNGRSIYIQLHQARQTLGVWQVTSTWPPTAENLTLIPSIHYITHGRAPCGWHFIIVNGEVTPTP